MTVSSQKSGRVQLGLERIVGFFENTLPSDPRSKLRVVHVSGTNGKGSVCALISEALKTAGYKVGTFNSPHFLEPRDAVRINGIPIPRDEYKELRGWINKLDAENNAGQLLTLFEQATVAAIWWFAQNSVDIAVIEVGMGGLRDATNVFGTPSNDHSSTLGVGKSLVQCICPIDMDHVGMIGNTIEEIAFEKTGIIRPGSWVIIGAQNHVDAFHKIRHVARKLSPECLVNIRRQPTSDYHATGFSIGDSDMEARIRQSPIELPTWASFQGTGKRCLAAKYPPAPEYNSSSASKDIGVHDNNHPSRNSVQLDLPLVLPGYYQAGNASIAFYALDVLRIHFGFDKLTDSAIQVGFQNVVWPGRLSWLPISKYHTPLPTSQKPAAVADNSDGDSSTSTSTSSGGLSSNDWRRYIPQNDMVEDWILADGAHNEPAALELRKYVDTTLRRIAQQRHIHANYGRNFLDRLRVRWVVGFTRGKDVVGILRQLVRPKDQIWLVPFSHPDEMPWIQSGSPQDIYQTVIDSMPDVVDDQMEMAKFNCLADALRQICELQSDSHINVLCGSLYLVADLYRELQMNPFEDLVSS